MTIKHFQHLLHLHKVVIVSTPAAGNRPSAQTNQQAKPDMTCTLCLVTKPAEKFYKNRYAQDLCICIACVCRPAATHAIGQHAGQMQVCYACNQVTWDVRFYCSILQQHVKLLAQSVQQFQVAVVVCASTAATVNCFNRYNAMCIIIVYTLSHTHFQ